jgi:hypothetical protein
MIEASQWICGKGKNKEMKEKVRNDTNLLHWSNAAKKEEQPCDTRAINNNKQCIQRIKQTMDQQFFRMEKWCVWCARSGKTLEIQYPHRSTDSGIMQGHNPVVFVGKSTISFLPGASTKRADGRVVPACRNKLHSCISWSIYILTCM